MADAPTMDHADVERIRALLKDPVAVHLNMLHGHIAKIDMHMLAHAHGQEMQDRWAAFERWEAEQATPSPPVAAVPAAPVAPSEIESKLWNEYRDGVEERFDADPGGVESMGPELWHSWDAWTHRAALAAQPQPQPAQPLTDARINAIADGIFDHQRTSEKMPPLGREGFRELVGSAIAQWTAPSTLPHPRLPHEHDTDNPIQAAPPVREHG